MRLSPEKGNVFMIPINHSRKWPLILISLLYDVLPVAIFCQISLISTLLFWSIPKKVLNKNPDIMISHGINFAKCYGDQQCNWFSTSCLRSGWKAFRKESLHSSVVRFIRREIRLWHFLQSACAFLCLQFDNTYFNALVRNMAVRSGLTFFHNWLSPYHLTLPLL